MNYYLHVLKNYFQFNGRARRKEYWMFVLFNVIFGMLAVFIDNIMGTDMEDLGYGLVYILYVLAVLIPGMAVAVRRLHDVGKTGWFILIAFIPLVGGIWLIVLFCTNSEPGVNKYGENPKNEEFMQVIHSA